MDADEAERVFDVPATPPPPPDAMASPAAPPVQLALPQELLGSASRAGQHNTIPRGRPTSVWAVTPIRVCVCLELGVAISGERYALIMVACEVLQ